MDDVARTKIRALALGLLAALLVGGLLWGVLTLVGVGFTTAGNLTAGVLMVGAIGFLTWQAARSRRG